jgi:hypothetical protein
MTFSFSGAREHPRDISEGKRSVAEVVPKRAHLAAAVVRLERRSSTTLEHAGTLLRQRYGVKDYFPIIFKARPFSSP